MREKDELPLLFGMLQPLLIWDLFQMPNHFLYLYKFPVLSRGSHLFFVMRQGLELRYFTQLLIYPIIILGVSPVCHALLWVVSMEACPDGSYIPAPLGAVSGTQASSSLVTSPVHFFPTVVPLV